MQDLSLNLISLIKRTINKNSTNKQIIFGFLSEKTMLESFEALKKWIRYELDLGRSIKLGDLGVISNQYINNEEVIYLKINEKLLLKFGLKQNSNDMKYHIFPTIIINYNNVMKYINSNIEKEKVIQSISSLILQICDIIINCDIFELEISILGRIIGNNKIITVIPHSNLFSLNKDRKVTIKKIIESKEVKKKYVMQWKEIKLNKEKNKKLINENNEIKNKNIMQLKEIKINKEKKSIIENDNSKKNYNFKIKNSSIFSKDNFISPVRRIHKIDENQISNELFIAGSDPLSLYQDYSYLADDAKNWLKNKFTKPPNSKIRNPPIIDSFSRTLAAPICTQYNSLSASSRIGLNYTPLSKFLYIDKISKGLKYLKIKENKTKLYANGELLQELSTENEDIKFLISKEKCDKELIKKVLSKKKCYNRYKDYIYNEIKSDIISKIKKDWMTNVLESVPSNYEYLDQEESDYLINNLIEEIAEEYKIAIKKSILDFILKDKQEQLRIGITQRFDPAEEWGKKEITQIKADKEWVSKYSNLKDVMENNLNLFCSGTLKIMIVCGPIEKESFFKLPENFNELFYLNEFKEIQDLNRERLKQIITENWIEDIAEVYKKDITNLENKDLYYESIATLMSSQIRDIITRSIENYLEFFKKFKKENYLNVQECIEKNKNPNDLLENSFLIIRLKEDQNNIILENDEENILNTLMNLINETIKVSEGLIRPENSIKKSEKKVLSKIGEMPKENEDDETIEEEYFSNIKNEIKNIILKNMKEINKCKDIFEPYKFLFFEKEKIEEFKTKELSKDDFVKKIKQYDDTFNEINENIPFEIFMNMIKIDCFEIKKNLLDLCSFYKKEILKIMLDLIDQNNINLTNELSNKLDEFSTNPRNEQMLVHQQNLLSKLMSEDQHIIIENFKNLKNWVYLYYDTQDEISQEFLNLLYKTFTNISNLPQRIDDINTNLENQKNNIEGNLQTERVNFGREIKLLCEQIQEFKSTKDLYQINENFNQVITLNDRLERCIKNKNKLNEKEKLIGSSKSNFEDLKNAEILVKEFKVMWELIKDWKETKQEWLKKSKVINLNYENVDKSMKQMINLSKVTVDNLKQITESNVQHINFLKDNINEMEDFNKNLPLIKFICNPGLMKRHFEEFTKVANENDIPIYFDNQDFKYNLEELISYDLNKIIDQLLEISEKGSREYTNQKLLEEMEKEWKDINLEIKNYKIPGTFVITGNTVEEVMAILDDQLVKTQSIKGSPYAVYFKKRIENWEECINYIKNCIDYLIKVQGLWIYMEPIFSSEDIMKSLPEQGSKFKEIDSFWRYLLQKLNGNPLVIDINKDKKLLGYLKDNNETLELIHKKLNSYLDKKRSEFPRFYFLSQDSLIEVLSEAKDPTKIQKFCKILFEGIQSLKFNQKKEIEGIISSEGEYIKFEKNINTEIHKGLVEQWLRILEEKIIYEVRNFIEKAIHDFAKLEREEFVLDRPGQAVLNIDMTIWTAEIEDYLIEKGYNGLKEYYEILNHNIENVVKIIKTNISKLNRCTLEALIILDVHNRDIVKQLNILQVNNINDFNYEAQLRYYWEQDLEKENEQLDTVVKIINNNLKYNYEYLGNSNRLVITPLTDRCYRTLCGAISLNYGGAPEGPAGTGKTETVKDLAKALARMIVVFNCNDKMDFKSMGRFFKGLASSGGWACLDEFNRINLEVLSVIAQQIQEIQNAITLKKENFNFEGSYISLKLTCNCFITMNPGYAGRSELPDNLKALFRSVAMMVPDYAMIAEIRLYSFGFFKAKILAKKIVTTYKLCSEQILAQKHYDYGMRAVNSVLVAAGNLRKSIPDEKEEIQVLRAILEVNEAKFLNIDTKLFKDITEDLFPSVSLPPKDFGKLLECIKIVMEKNNLIETDYFINKVIDLYQMILVRHGLMVVGDPFSCKSTNINVLKESLNLMNEKEYGENKVEMEIINPKSIDNKLLYGYTDMATNEWTDGVLPVKFKQMANDNSPNRKWLIFDGPVDAVWIENMNTVLDDNKKLCLSNGDVFYMSNTMNMIFEPIDLLEASPATVSRCGMVYMEPHMMGWEFIYKSWKNTLPKIFNDDKDSIDIYFYTILEPLINLFSKNKFILTNPISIQGTVKSLLNLVNKLIKQLDDFEYESQDFKNRISIFDQILVFCTVWSFGASVDSKNRKKFDSCLKRFINTCDKSVDQIYLKKHRKIKLPDTNLFDYELLLKKQNNVNNERNFDLKSEWNKWINNIEENFDANENFNPNQILIETADTIRYSYLIKIFFEESYNSLICGSTGTGKTVYIKNVMKNLDKNKYIFCEIGFSSKIQVSKIQEIIESNLIRKNSKGFFGPPSNKKMIIFIDDFSMPKKEIYGSQPPIELIRQLLDQKGFFDNKEKNKPFKNIVDFVLIASMSKPTSSENYISPRMTRHLSLLSFIEFEEEQMKRIYFNILNLYWNARDFGDEIKKLANKVINASYDLYNSVLNNFLPTPNKSHYLFNLRDFGKVIFGICLSNNDKLKTSEQLIKLWIHENWRVFGDRLNSEEDRLNLLNTYIKKIFQKTFGMNFDNTFSYLDNNGDKQINTLSEMRNLIFSDVLNLRGNSYRPYEEIKNIEKLNTTLNKYLEQYNILYEKKLNIVLFNFAIEHLLIISRIFKQQGGHALLVGIGGSGRKSLSNFAAFISNYDVFEIELTQNYSLDDWHEDLKKLLKMSGGKAKDTVFIFSDTQIKMDDFVEDINNILNNGDIPSLFSPEDKTEVLELARKVSKNENKDIEKTDDLYNFFIEKVKKYLHLSLTFSPIGNAFRERIRLFPSLINCCTIDWFFEWPKEGLIFVATNFLKDLEVDEKQKKNCVEIVELFHSDCKKWSLEYKKELGRINYITPTIFIELINQFKSLFKQRNEFVKNLQYKYENGYKMIIEAEKNVSEMQIKLTSLVPELEVSAKETSIAMEVVSKKTNEAEAQEKLISVDEEKARKIKEKAETIKMSCEKDLEEIKPKLEKAEKGLKNLDENKIKNMRGAKLLSKPLMYLFFGVAIVLGAKIEKKKNLNTLKYEIDLNETGLKILQRKGLALELQEYNNEEMMEEKTYIALKDHFENPEATEFLNAKTIKKANEDAACIFVWLECQKDLYIVNKELKPKKANYKKASEEVELVTYQLNIKQKELNNIKENVNNLKSDLESKKAKKENLEERYKTCKLELMRAKTLIENLSDEKDRWLELGNMYKKDLLNIVGDVLISAGFICYLGPFTAKYRENILSNWISKTKELEIPQSNQYDIIKIFGDPIVIRKWNISGLPDDNFSISNGIILSNSNRYPLLIDPQLQANKWIKTYEKSNNLIILKQQGNYLKKFEIAIRLGNPIILEDIGEELDPALNPILLKQYNQNGWIKLIKLGDQVIEFNENFKLFITTKLRNPHYLPEISTKVEIINFMITFVGLKDQLLALIVKSEKPQLEIDRENLIIEGANNKQDLKNLENKILEILALDKKKLLEDETAINILTASKSKSIEIKEKQKVAEETEKEINKARQNYLEISKESSCLFFVITEMANIEPTYQYSLVYFLELYLLSILNSTKSDDINERLDNISKHFLVSLYNNISRSIFVKDKLLFSFLLCIRLKEYKKEIQNEKYELFLKGTINVPQNLKKKPNLKWLTQKIWVELNSLNNFKGCFEGIIDNFVNNIEIWEKIYNSQEPYKEKLPDSMKNINDFDKLLLFKAFRPDKLIPIISLFIINNLGKQFIDPPKFSLNLIYEDSNNSTPLIFILTPGINPYNNLLNFANEKNIVLEGISLGQGQGPIAIKLIDQALEKGNWVVLQNCHLAEGFMPILEKKCDEIIEKQKQIHSNFRLWLTTYPTKFFPISILQNGIKMTNEPPKGLNNNLMNAFYLDIIQEKNIFEDCEKINEFQRLLYGLCFFHSIIQERRAFGSLGWNIPYEFNESDLRISVRQLKLFLNKYPTILPLQALKYLTAECNYGGRVTDDKDRRLINTLLEDYYNEDIATIEEQTIMVTDDFEYKIPKTPISYSDFLDEIKKIPSIITDPSIYGFNKNASITKELNETNNLLNTLLLTKGGEGENDNSENFTKELINKILNEFPNYFDIDKSLAKYPIKKDESMNTVFIQELIRYNKLLEKIKISLEDIVKAFDGKILFTEELESTKKYIENGKIPTSWLKVSYPSLKSLGGYIKDLFKKIEFFNKWLEEGQPKEFWISGFYFTHGFLTGILQNYARKFKIEIDKLEFDFKVINNKESLDNLENGTVVHGLFLEACRYNYEKKELDESEPKVLFNECPKIYLLPKLIDNTKIKNSYECPLYKTSSRRGELLTTGQSTNFVMFINLPTSKDQSHWVKRGVVALTQLND